MSRDGGREQGAPETRSVQDPRARAVTAEYAPYEQTYGAIVRALEEGPSKTLERAEGEVRGWTKEVEDHLAQTLAGIKALRDTLFEAQNMPWRLEGFPREVERVHESLSKLEADFERYRKTLSVRRFLTRVRRQKEGVLDGRRDLVGTLARMLNALDAWREEVGTVEAEVLGGTSRLNKAIAPDQHLPRPEDVGNLPEADSALEQAMVEAITEVNAQLGELAERVDRWQTSMAQALEVASREVEEGVALGLKELAGEERRAVLGLLAREHPEAFAKLLCGWPQEEAVERLRETARLGEPLPVLIRYWRSERGRDVGDGRPGKAIPPVDLSPSVRAEEGGGGPGTANQPAAFGDEEIADHLPTAIERTPSLAADLIEMSPKLGDEARQVARTQLERMLLEKEAAGQKAQGAWGKRIRRVLDTIPKKLLERDPAALVHYMGSLRGIILHRDLMVVSEDVECEEEERDAEIRLARRLAQAIRPEDAARMFEAVAGEETKGKQRYPTRPSAWHRAHSQAKTLIREEEKGGGAFLPHWPRAIPEVVEAAVKLFVYELAQAMRVWDVGRVHHWTSLPGAGEIFESLSQDLNEEGPPLNLDARNVEALLGSRDPECRQLALSKLVPRMRDA